MLNIARVIDFLEGPVLLLYRRRSSQGIHSRPGISGGGYRGTQLPPEHRRKRRWGRAVVWLVVILLVCFFLPHFLQFVQSILMPNYLDLTSEIVVAQVGSVKTHVPGEMCATVVLYDKDGHQTFNRSLLVEGDTLNLQGDMIQYANGLNAMGLHSGYRITGWQKQYGGCQDGPSTINNAMPMDGSHDNFFRFVQEHKWLSPLVVAKYDSGVSVPLDGKTHHVLLLQKGLVVMD